MTERVVHKIPVRNSLPSRKVKPGEVIHYLDPQRLCRWIGIQPNGEEIVLDDEKNPIATPYDSEKG